MIRSLPLQLATLLLLSFSISPAQAEELSTEQCLDQHEQAQVKRSSGDLLGAKEALLQCSNASCPGMIQSDCSSWYSEVKQETPSILVSARLSGEDMTRVRVLVDGEEVATQLDGRELALNPGEHTVRVEAPDLEAQEKRVLLVKGSRARSLVFDFEDPNQIAAQEAAPATSAQAEEEKDTYRPVPPVTYILSGVAVAGLATGITLGVLGANQDKKFEDSCAPYCTEKEEQSVKTKLLIADIGFGVAVAAGVGALVSYLVRPRVERQSAFDSTQPLIGSSQLGMNVAVDHGAQFVLGGSF